MSDKKRRIAVDRLVPGLYIDLELTWDKHPFLRRAFRIKSQEQIEVIRELGLTTVLVDFDRSAGGLVPPPPPPERPADAAPPTPQHSQAQWEQKKASIEQARGFKERHAQRSQQYMQTARAAKQLMRDLDFKPANAVQSAGVLVDGMMDAFSADRDVIVNLITLQDADQDMYHHSLNVLVLSMLLASAAGFTGDELREVGLGALLHDLGKVKVPSQILLKTTPLSGPEQALLQLHTRYGADLASKIGGLSPTVQAIIAQHHELLDGSGYPDKLREEKLPRAVRVVAVVNLYDNLCNPPSIADAMIPKVALSVLFTRYKGKLDGELVALFIRALGIYPPGTVVKLNDGSIGMVIAVDSKDLLKPQLLMYNADIPRKEAVILDLKDEELNIDTALAPGQYPKEVFEYLGVRARAGYFFERGPT